jgi:hypothetical protein
MKRRENQFREALDAKREALRRAANQPKPEQEWEPETPELRAEVLADRLQERDAELAKEQERRRAAERKVQELSNLRRTLGDLSRLSREPVPGTSSCYRGGGRRMRPSAQDKGNRGL